MRKLAAPLRNTLPVVALFVLANGAHALTCEELRTSVEAKIQGKGVTRFNVTIVEEGTPAVGQVVGTCGRGSKKLVYTQDTGVESNKPTASQAKPASALSSRVITECADGRVITQGSCKR
jgi:hypothetical protein